MKNKKKTLKTKKTLKEVISHKMCRKIEDGNNFWNYGNTISANSGEFQTNLAPM